MSKSYIFLSGGGDIEESFKFDEKYFSLLPNYARILYIPVALKRSSGGFEACYDWFSTLISHPVGKKEIDFTMLLQKKEIPDFDVFDSVYVGGGNTYKLLDYFVKTGIGQEITKYTEKRGVYYGGSAGAVVVGKDIRTVEEENDKNYQHFNGVNIVGGRSIIPHYNESLDKKIFEMVLKTESEVLAIPEDSGIILHENNLEPFGDVFIFDRKSKKRI